MAKYTAVMVFYISCILFITMMSSCCGATDDDRQIYIVYMGSLPEGEYSPASDHLSILQDVVEGSSAMDTWIRSYKRSFNGFAAKLTNQEKQRLSSMQGVVSVFPSKTFQLQTTNSWDFMGFRKNVKRNPTVESNVIVGVIDSGIWPESESFNDQGFGPAPEKWKGACKGGENFTCNKKIIGARHYASENNELNDARDKLGHGTHTASTAAGNHVKDASFYGLAQGTARGGVPSARIAAYKVCQPHGCQGADLLAAFDDAIADGVDIITISIGGNSASDFRDDPIAIGAFHAMEKGILTLNSAGNSGSTPGNVGSVAPWMLTVAASSTDRRLINKVVLGNGITLTGNAVNSFTLDGTQFGLVYGNDIQSRCSEDSIQGCLEGCLDKKSVKGKIVVCDTYEGHNEAFRAGALGSIMEDKRFGDTSFVVPLPASGLNISNFEVVKSYMNSTKKPRATILKSEAQINFDAPVVASFSSRGPNLITPEIMKPDITAPGVDILAAFSPLAPASDNAEDKRSVKYNFLSGTSMSCPHAAGAATYVKTFHPHWSPSAIKSALMTTAWPMNATKNSDGEFAYGSGHIDPIRALHPGLVYQTYKEDYIKMLCSIGYDVETVRKISGERSTCPKEKTSPKDLNSPSMAAEVPSRSSFEVSFHRTVTNVGLPDSTYTAQVASASKIKIQVVPSTLFFKSLNETKSFVVTVAGKGLPEVPLGVVPMVSASLVWSDGNHRVRSPIVLFKNTAAS